MRRWLAVVAICWVNILFAQKGIPPEKQTSAQVNTHFPKHEDFSMSKLARLKVAAGYKVSVAASGLGKPRMMALDDKGALYVTRRDIGDVLRLSDADSDGTFEEMTTVVAKFSNVHGILIHDGWLYLCSSKKLARGRLNPDGTVGKMDTLINDLPDGSQHDNRTLRVGPDGKLYVTVGSDCNDCKETNPEHATILQMNLDGTGRRVFARGLRNTIGIDWHPETKALWGFDHGTDWRGDTIPPEELNKIVDGGNYGWPLVYGKQQVDETREDPVGTTKAAYAKTTVPAEMTFPAHSAPLDFLFLNKFENIDPKWKGDGLVTWHGSWNRKKPEGFKVQRIHFENGQPVAAEDFLSGFLSADGNTRFGRPTGLIISANKIFVSDDANGVIYCVMPAK